MRRLLAVLVTVQLVAAVDFTMLLPLGPDLAAPLGLDVARLPTLVAAQTVAAALAGLFGGGWLERTPRRRAMLLLLLGLGAADGVAALAGGWRTLLLARMAAGAAGGQVSALSLAVLSDAVPDARRGHAVGILMTANAIAAVAGVPLCLWLAERLGWQAPFMLLALGAVGAAGLTGEAVGRQGWQGVGVGAFDGPKAWAPLCDRLGRRALLLTFLFFGSSFLLNPNLSAFVQHNLGLPREQLSGLYATAGLVAIGVQQYLGRAVDRWGALRVGSIAVVVFAAVVGGFVVHEGTLPPAPGFILLLSSLQSRNVAVRTLTTRVPRPEERGRFMSLLSSAQYFGAASGAVGSSLLLRTGADGRLEGMAGVGVLAMALAVGTLPLLADTQRRVGAPAPGRDRG